MRTGAAGVIVGYGSTRGVTTTDEVLGISVPMATAIADAAAARREYLDETGGRYVHVLADGDIHTSGELAKAIACGADAVVLGTPLAEAAEALGDGWFWPVAAAHPSLPRGALLQIAVGERPSAGAGAQRAVRRSVRRPESRWRTAPFDGQGRLLRPQGIPEGRPDGRLLKLGACWARGVQARELTVAVLLDAGRPSDLAARGDGQRARFHQNEVRDA